MLKLKLILLEGCSDIETTETTETTMTQAKNTEIRWDQLSNETFNILAHMLIYKASQQIQRLQGGDRQQTR